MKYVRIFRILVSALLLASLAAVMSSMPAFALANIFVYPNSGTIGSSIHVYGGGYTPGVSVYVYFSSDEALVGDRIDEEVTAYELVALASVGVTGGAEGVIDTFFIVPDQLTDGSIRERVHNGTYYVYITYYASRTLRSVTGFRVEGTSEITPSPAQSTVNNEVKITGSNFGYREDFIIKYDGKEVPIQSGDITTDRDGNFQSIILIPASTAGVHSITATGEISDSEAETEFKILPKITVSPQAGVAGDVVTVSGTGFGDRILLNIYFSNFRVANVRTTDQYGSFSLTFEILPAGKGSHYVEVTDGDGNAAREIFNIGATTVNISPNSGYAGTEITISGVGFAASKMVTIKFADVQVRTTTTDVSGKFGDKFIVPQLLSGNYDVVVTDGVNTVATIFTITTSVSLSPTTGNIGTTLTINGNGFSGAVTIKYDDDVVSTTTADASGTFVANFEVPASLHGKHIITASDARNTIPTEFNVESVPPPIPTPLLPATGSRAKSQDSFQWGAVTDPSGVNYILQIASDVNFTNLLLEKKDLGIPQYTLTKTERLPSTSQEAPYYWRVRAVDKASNESGWSGPSSLYVSAFPDWAKYILIAFGALVAALVVFWLGMKLSPTIRKTE